MQSHNETEPQKSRWRKSFSWDSTPNYYNLEEKTILREINAYHDGSTLHFYLRLNVYPENDTAQKLAQKLEETYYKRTEAIESEPDKDKKLDCSFKSLIYYPTAPGLQIKEYENALFDRKISLQINLSTPYKRYVGELIYLIDAIFDIHDIRDELLEGYKIKPLCANLDFLKKLVENKRYEEAINAAMDAPKFPGNDKLIYDLGLHFEEIEELNVAFETYQKIPPNNSHYAKANLRILHIISTSRTHAMLTKRKDASLDDEEKNDEFVIPEIDALLKVPKNQQRRIDQRIHQLSGCYDLKPIIENVRFDASTILAFCNHIKTLNKKIAILEKSASTIKLHESKDTLFSKGKGKRIHQKNWDIVCCSSKKIKSTCIK